MHTIAIGITFGIAAFVHTTAGFGSALIAMAILVPLIGLSVAAPLVAIIALPLQLMIILRYRERLSFKALRTIVIALMIGTLIGISGISWIDEDILLTCLGLFILAYVVYTAFGKHQLVLGEQNRWSLLFGVASGVLNGAYNSGGPIIVVYYKSRGHMPDEFRVNVQSTFIVATFFVILIHLLHGNITGEVVSYYGSSFIGMVIGFGSGMVVSRYIMPVVFHWLVLGLLAILGLQLLLPNL